jgi:flagellar export protein FliJ
MSRSSPAQAVPAGSDIASMSVLDSLLRLRTWQRQQSALQLKQVQEERDRQAGQVSALKQAMEQAQREMRPDDVFEVNDYHTWRLRQELNMRRESARLQQRERDVEIQQGRHVQNVREELSLDAVLEAKEQTEMEEERRAEARQMDEIASRKRL